MNYEKFEIQHYASLDVREENLISEEVLNKWSKFILEKYQRKELKKSEIGQHGIVAEKIRGDFIYWLDPKSEESEVQECLSFLNRVREDLNKTFFLNLKSVESHLTVYPPGGAYEKHVDVFKKHTPHSLQRQVSLILYLNKEMVPEDHGELILYSSSNEVLEKIHPKFGRLIYFMSDEFPHEVLTTLNRERISLTAWFLG